LMNFEMENVNKQVVFGILKNSPYFQVNLLKFI
jgi:hypothetical protein